MYNLNEFTTRDALDQQLAEKITTILSKAIADKGKASIAVSGGSTPKGLFKILSEQTIDWSKVSITLADERWVDFDDEASNTRLVHDYLLQNNAQSAHFFHLKQPGELSEEVLTDLNAAVLTQIHTLDVLILGMGEDGHTASLFPCSEQIKVGLALDNPNALMLVQPATAPYTRISFTFNTLAQSKNIFLHISSVSKKQVLEKAVADLDVFDMPIRAFLHNDKIDTQVYWAD
jgi:6-phosphogluconolactonase